MGEEVKKLPMVKAKQRHVRLNGPHLPNNWGVFHSHKGRIVFLKSYTQKNALKNIRKLNKRQEKPHNCFTILLNILNILFFVYTLLLNINYLKGMIHGTLSSSEIRFTSSVFIRYCDRYGRFYGFTDRSNIAVILLLGHFGPIRDAIKSTVAVTVIEKNE